MVQGQYKDRLPKIVKRLSRDEAVRYVLDALMGKDLPFQPDQYHGGAAQILSDAMCVSEPSVRNYATRGRKTLEKSYIGQ